MKAQTSNGFNLVVGAGASYFFNDKSLNRRVDNTRLVGVNYTLHNKNKNFIFNPGLNFQTNQYQTKIKEDLLAQINQNVFNLNLDVLLKLNKHLLLRVGLLFNKLISSDVSIAQPYNRGSSFYYGSSEIEKEYHPTNFQAGVTVGLSIPFKLFKRDHKFNLKVVEFASSLVKQDYILSKALIGQETKVLSIKARPSMLIIGFDFNFKRIKKNKTEEEK